MLAASIRARCENACGKFPRCRPVLGVELLRVEPERRGDVEELLHQVAGPLLLADDRQRRDEPERADQEASLLAGQAVVGLAGAVAEHEAVLCQIIGDRVDRLAQPFVVAGQEAEDRRQQRRCVERVCVVVLTEDAILDAAVEDVGLDLVGGRAPLGLELGFPARSRPAWTLGRAPPNT